MGRIAEHDRRRTRILSFLFPLSIAAHIALLFEIQCTRTPSEHPVMVGYEGRTKLIPTITVLDERTIESAANAHRRQAMLVQNVIIEGEKRENPDRERPGREPRPRSSKRESPVSAVPTLPVEDKPRAYPSRASSPYREDYVILRFVQPEYPPDALARLAEGYALVEAYINEYGQVSDASVRAAYGPLSFEASALDAVRQFLFRPVRVDGKPSSFWVSFYVRFQMRR